MSLLEAVISVDVSRLSYQDKTRMLAPAAGRESLASDYSDLVLLPVILIVRNFIDAGLWDSFSGFVLHRGLLIRANCFR